MTWSLFFFSMIWGIATGFITSRWPWYLSAAFSGLSLMIFLLAFWRF